MADLAPGLVDIEVDTTVFRPATFLENAVGQLGWAALAGLLLAALVIGLGLGSWRYALIAALAVLVSGTAAALTLQATGAVMNTMTLAGLALALTVAVGDAVADLDSLRTRGRIRARRAAPLARSATASVRPMRRRDRAAHRHPDHRAAPLAVPVLFGALISAVAIAPSFFVPGLDGEILRALAIAYLVTLGIAMGRRADRDPRPRQPAAAAQGRRRGGERSAPRSRR